MKWQSGQPVESDYYLCAIIGENRPNELYWNGESWTYEGEYDCQGIVDNDQVPYYMKLDDIPMPEDW